MTKIKHIAAHAHRTTEQVFAHYGHIFFFAPIAFDHIGDFYGQASAVLMVVYTVVAFAFNNSDA